MQDNDIQDVTEALTKLVEYINDLAPQFTRDFQSEANKTDYLRWAVAEYQDWSKIPISNIMSQKYSFNSFVTSLHEPIQNLKQLSQLSGRPFPNTGIVASDDEQIDTLMVRYARKPRQVHWKDGRGYSGKRNQKARNSRRYSERVFQNARGRGEYVRCGEPWSKRHQFTERASREHT